MDIYCDKCQKMVGKIADEKIPSGRKLSVSCPQCGEKIFFEKPGADHTAIDFSPDVSAGRLASGQVPDYDFSIGEIIKEAWTKTSGIKGPVWGASLFFYLVVVVSSVLITLAAKVIGNHSAAVAVQAALQLTISVASLPVTAGLLLLGIRRSVGLPINFRMAFSCFGYILPILIASILVMIFCGIGSILIIPGIYLFVAYSMVFQLIIDKEMGPWQAMELSRKAVSKHWFKVFGLMLLMGLIYFFSILFFFVGIIWTLPMFYVVFGILYREIFGVSQKA